jgi:hypothetical protein
MLRSDPVLDRQAPDRLNFGVRVVEGINGHVNATDICARARRDLRDCSGPGVGPIQLVAFDESKVILVLAGAAGVSTSFAYLEQAETKLTIDVRPSTT